MIITRYLIYKTLNSQFYIFFILIFIFFLQKLVRTLGAAVDGDVPINIILYLLGLSIPKIAQLVIPLSLFMGLFLTLSRLYTESEIMVMFACGLGKTIIMRATLFLSMITMLLAVVNVIWLSPWSYKHQELVIANAKANPSIAALIAGKFHSFDNGKSVLFISNVNKNNCKRFFLAQLSYKVNECPSVVIGNIGNIYYYDNGSQLINLYKGTRYEGNALVRNFNSKNFKIINFDHYQALIGSKKIVVNNNDVEKMTISKLWSLSDIKARTELHWRITLVVSVFIMAMMVVPLSAELNPSKVRIFRILPGMLLYLIFFLLQISIHASSAKDNFNPLLWMWLTNLVYLFIILILNIWDSVLARRIRNKLYLRYGIKKSI